MKIKIFFSFLFSSIVMSLAGQIKCYEISDTIMHDTSFQDKSAIPTRINKIALIEPFVYKDIPAVKSIILNTINNELAGQFKYDVLMNDSLIIASENKDFRYLNNFFAKKDTFDAFMVIKQGFAQINYQNYSGTIDPRYESEIVILVYNKGGILIANSYNYTGTSIDKIFSQNVMKKVEKATKKTIDSVIDQLNKINANY